jgi:four helix bundle protein
MLKNFRCYQLGLHFFRLCESASVPRHLQDQLLRAASSIVLNLAEGSERVTDRDRRRFYRISMASVRECQAILDLAQSRSSEINKIADELGAAIFKLCKSIDNRLKLDTEA